MTSKQQNNEPCGILFEKQFIGCSDEENSEVQ